MSKPKKPVRSKEQILHDEAVKKETERQRKLVKEQLVPLLNKYSKNIENAKFILQVMNNAMKNAFDKLIQGEQVRLSGEHLSTISSDVMAQVAIMKAGDKDKLLDGGAINDLMFIFKDEPLGTTDSLLRGMVGEIEASIKDELLTRKFKTLKMKIL